jgi:hypothetical protein
VSGLSRLLDPLRGTGPRRHGTATIVLSIGGVAFLVLQLVIGTQAGLFPVPGRDELIWDRIGDALRLGAPIYTVQPVLEDTFWYAPPWAVAFAAISWLPIILQHLLFVAVRVASLRVIAGSWVGAGVICWFPLVAFDLAGGNFNLLVAAAIVAAVGGRPELAVWAALAKLSPAIAIHPGDWRPALKVLAFAVAITVPWLSLWPSYFAHLLANVTTPLGPELPIALLGRIAIAGGLLAVTRRPWARALAAAITIPAFYWGSLVVLVAPVAVLVREMLERDQPTGSLVIAQPL